MTPRVLVIDNYDSFTFNLVQYIGEEGADPVVHRNDVFTVDDLVALEPHAVVISPGPGRPEAAGVSIDAVHAFGKRGTPVLGVCLGHQAIAVAFGGSVVRAERVMHGKTSLVYHKGEGLLEGIPIPFEATRYHSLVVERSTLPASLKVTAETMDEIVMAVVHRDMPVHGVQFHPESILTVDGRQIIKNLLAAI